MIHRFSDVLCFTAFALNWSVLSNRHYQQTEKSFKGFHDTLYQNSARKIIDIPIPHFMIREKQSREHLKPSSSFKSRFFLHPDAAFEFLKRNKWEMPQTEAGSDVSEPCRPSAAASPENHIWQAINKEPLAVVGNLCGICCFDGTSLSGIFSNWTKQEQII